MNSKIFIFIAIAIIASSAGGSMMWMEYGSVCNNAVVEHLQKYSNLFDENIIHETYAIQDIRFPFGVHPWNIQECVDYIFEKRSLRGLEDES